VELAAVVPGVGTDHREWMGAYARLAMAVNTIGSPQTGKVTAAGEVEYVVDGKQMDVIHDTLAYVVCTRRRASCGRRASAGSTIT
jgi:hypothetical protein